MKLNRSKIDLSDLDVPDFKNSRKWREAKERFAKLKEKVKKDVEIKKAPRILYGFIVRSDYRPPRIKDDKVAEMPKPNWTAEEALKRFYKFNRGLDFQTVKLVRVNPCVGDSFWVLPLYVGFCVTVTINRETGKHLASIRYTARKKNWRVAVCQIECNFYNKKELTTKVKNAIGFKKFFQTTELAETIIPK